MNCEIELQILNRFEGMESLLMKGGTRDEKITVMFGRDK